MTAPEAQSERESKQCTDARTFRDGTSVDQDEREDDVEQADSGELIRGTPGDDAAIVSEHVVVVICTFNKFFFEEAFV